MNFKCLECGHIFPGSEVSHWREPHGEYMTGCPVCKCAFAEMEHCRKCGGAFLEDELYGGFCRECLAESMTPANLLDYMMDNDLEWDFYTDFYFDRVELLESLRREFLRRAIEDVCFVLPEGGTVHRTVERGVTFVVNGGDGLWEYAQWYAEQKGTAKHDRTGIPHPPRNQQV